MMITDAELHRRVTRYEVAKRVLIVFTAAVVSVSLGVLLSLAVQGKQRAVENRETLHTIKDCTQPSGECYKRSQRQAASAVASINRVAIYAAACAAQYHHPTVEQVQSCVITRLAKDHRR